MLVPETQPQGSSATSIKMFVFETETVSAAVFQSQEYLPERRWHMRIHKHSVLQGVAGSSEMSDGVVAAPTLMLAT